ncbi:hypothetical protein ACJX0J_037868, partial [Zea mays]
MRMGRGRLGQILGHSWVFLNHFNGSIWSKDGDEIEAPQSIISSFLQVGQNMYLNNLKIES